MQPMLLCLFSGRRSEKTFENAQGEKIKQIQPMWFCIVLCKRFEDTFENTQWGKVEQMQLMWLCIHSFKRFEETFENAQWRKMKQMQPIQLHNAHNFSLYCKIHINEKLFFKTPRKSYCVFSSSSCGVLFS